MCNKRVGGRGFNVNAVARRRNPTPHRGVFKFHRQIFTGRPIFRRGREQITERYQSLAAVIDRNPSICFRAVRLR